MALGVLQQVLELPGQELLLLLRGEAFELPELLMDMQYACRRIRKLLRKDRPERVQGIAAEIHADLPQWVGRRVTQRC
jgi:hypothetical protein